MDKYNKSPIPLNIPEDKLTQFDEVSFVLDMKEYSLRVFIKHLWENLMSLANIFENKRTDVSNILDKIMSGHKWNENEIDETLQYAVFETFIVQYNTLEKTITILNNDHETIYPPVKVVTLDEAKKYRKTMIKSLK